MILVSKQSLAWASLGVSLAAIQHPGLWGLSTIHKNARERSKRTKETVVYQEKFWIRTN